MQTDTIITIASATVATGVVAAAIHYVRNLRTEVIVEKNEQVFATTKGLRQGPLAIGVHRFWGQWQEDVNVERFDTRAQDMQIPGQEILTRDLVAIKVSATLRYSILEGERLLDSLENWKFRIYSEAQSALREAVGTKELDDLLANRSDLSDALQATLTPILASFGLQLESAQALDVMLGGDLKRAMAEVVEARAQGKAKLERARAESASLRTLEVAEKAANSSGNTLVLGLDGKQLPK